MFDGEVAEGVISELHNAVQSHLNISICHCAHNRSRPVLGTLHLGEGEGEEGKGGYGVSGVLGHLVTLRDKRTARTGPTHWPHPLTLPSSTRLVSMTMVAVFCSHTMFQKSTTVCSRGPCVEMYSRVLLKPYMYTHCDRARCSHAC